MGVRLVFTSLPFSWGLRIFSQHPKLCPGFSCRKAPGVCRQKCLEERDRLRPCFLPAIGELPKTGTWESYLCDWCSSTLLPSIKGITNTLACPPGQSMEGEQICLCACCGLWLFPCAGMLGSVSYFPSPCLSLAVVSCLSSHVFYLQFSHKRWSRRMRRTTSRSLPCPRT